jgi:site-specific recombinase XerD
MSIQQIVKKYLKLAGLNENDYSVHSLRHTFLTQVYSKTRDLRLTQELAGHSSPTMTARYAHIGQQDKQDAVNSLWAKEVAA